MTKSKHTPGPWVFDEVKTSCGRAFRVGSAENLEAVKSLTDRRKRSYACLYDDYGQGENQQMADARLIAAAPELLQVLQAYVDWEVEYMTINNLGDPEKQHNVKWARAVIAKATGAE